MVVDIKALSLSAAASSLGPIESKRIIKMKIFVVFACVVLSVLAADKYNSKYDNFDVETLITNDRLLKSYVNCFLDKGKCTAEGSDFKKTLPEAVSTVCGKCTEKQKLNVKKVIKAIQQKFPTQWEELVKKNDPTGKHRADFDKFIQGS
ncbi:ejaculatory bulb-specific protein 3-like [Melitaea cinxia]|uniref:ejaculatory bulb-specific protein 3-like n=1 Tax=Melitaea cinxia TaxID=113334 RepID=UPI001E27463B|nr:ejaculatory bulb-specific protein 3-like [Melitaea cinxia]